MKYEVLVEIFSDNMFVGIFDCLRGIIVLNSFEKRVEYQIYVFRKNYVQKVIVILDKIFYFYNRDIQNKFGGLF